MRIIRCGRLFIFLRTLRIFSVRVVLISLMYVSNFETPYYKRPNRAASICISYADISKLGTANQRTNSVVVDILAMKEIQFFQKQATTSHPRCFVLKAKPFGGEIAELKRQATYFQSRQSGTFPQAQTARKRCGKRKSCRSAEKMSFPSFCGAARRRLKSFRGSTRIIIAAK